MRRRLLAVLGIRIPLGARPLCCTSCSQVRDYVTASERALMDAKRLPRCVCRGEMVRVWSGSLYHDGQDCRCGNCAEEVRLREAAAELDTLDEDPDSDDEIDLHDAAQTEREADR